MRAGTKIQRARVLIADDDPIVRQVVRSVLGDDGPFTVVAEAEDGGRACELVAQQSPDILLLDLLMPNLPGLEALKRLTQEHTGVHTVLLCSSISDRQVLEALQLGARGIVLKSGVAELVSALQAIMGGRYWIRGHSVSNVVEVVQELSRKSAAEPNPARKLGLTARELEVISLVAQGSSNKDVASELGITEETVKRHLTNVFDKVGMSNRLELALYALEHGLIQR